jgi:hypothetical protein
VRERPLAMREEGLRQVVERAPTAFAPVAHTSWPIMVGAPGAHVLTLAPRTVERTAFPPQCMGIGLTLVGIEELLKYTYPTQPTPCL